MRRIGDSSSGRNKSATAPEKAFVADKPVNGCYDCSRKNSHASRLGLLQRTAAVRAWRVAVQQAQPPLLRQGNIPAAGVSAVAAAGAAAAAGILSGRLHQRHFFSRSLERVGSRQGTTAVSEAAAAEAAAADTVSSSRFRRLFFGFALAAVPPLLLQELFQQNQCSQKQLKEKRGASWLLRGAALHQQPTAWCEQVQPQLLQQVQIQQEQQQKVQAPQQADEKDLQLLQQMVGEPRSAWPLSVHSTQQALQQLGLAAGVSQVAANYPVEDRAVFAAVSTASPDEPAAAAAHLTAAAAASTAQQQLMALAQQLFPNDAPPAGAAAAAPGSAAGSVLQPLQKSGDSSRGSPWKPRCLVAIVDGHGGPDVAEYVHQHLPRFVAAELAAGDGTDLKFAEKALARAFCRLVGACCLALLFTEKGIVVANSGDCMAVLQRSSGSSSSQLVELNKQQNANSPDERKRLQKLHPKEDDVVICKREWLEPRQPQNAFHSLLHAVGLLGSETQRGSCYVKGRLQPTRAFGDFMLKNEKYIEELQRGRRRRPPCTSSSAAAAAEATSGTAAAAAGTETWSFPYVIVDPQTQVFEKSEADQFVVVGTDGLWDFLSPAEAAAVVRSSLSSSSSSSGSTMTDLAKRAADALVREVMRKAATERGMSIAAALSAPPKQRRRIYDDTTVAVILLNSAGQQHTS
ncbi:protein phosphatase 2C, putative [Eimeria necatrix]|uniref:Protein phosphatase 2C, putative n=1 Tax=Eimeria necatrix TaxID=51315 RepID=U6ML08_9EIME|nr:protein phosphatase 2C, putative [Eimeria necatrix]CDJ63758.1 protein phosphatase 2C, putative [Eimeria necatrix]